MKGDATSFLFPPPLARYLRRLAFTFYVGSPEAVWLHRAGFPLFVSRRRLHRIRRVRRAAARWAMDSGGFTEIAHYGRWHTTPRHYADEVRSARDNIGLLDFAACQDWMCEPVMLAKTGKTVRDHQALTIASYLELRAIDATLPIIPVLQGWERRDYLDHVEQYARAGVELATLERVGLGSVCRRQDTTEAEAIIRALHAQGIRLHGFGFKVEGLARCWQYLASADSMAWSYAARSRKAKLALCGHTRCNNCLAFAAQWRLRVLRQATGVWEACPECGSTDVAGPCSDCIFWSCPECGHTWPDHWAHEFAMAPDRKGIESDGRVTRLVNWHREEAWG